uniref:Uncharacterized protein n=1 Tax=Cacopsylla melanoneura TaxID=428564 RepID=A0A8D9E8B9_9HEMI
MYFSSLVRRRCGKCGVWSYNYTALFAGVPRVCIESIVYGVKCPFTFVILFFLLLLSSTFIFSLHLFSRTHCFFFYFYLSRYFYFILLSPRFSSVSVVSSPFITSILFSSLRPILS